MVHAWVQLAPLLALLMWGVGWWVRRRRRGGALGREPERPREPAQQRFARGCRQALGTARMARRAGRLLLVPIAATLISAAGYVELIELDRGWAHPLEARMFLATLIGLYPFSLLSAFAGVAFLTMVDARLHGRSASIRQGLAVAWSKRRRIALWSLLSAGVGALLHGLQQLRSEWLLAPVVSWLAGAAWSVVSMFALPVIALEELPMRRVPGRAASLARRRWGEGVGGLSALAAAWMPVFLVIGVATCIIAGVTSFVVGLAAGFAALLVSVAVVGVQQQLLSLALYRFAVDGETLGCLHADDLARAPQPGR